MDAKEKLIENISSFFEKEGLLKTTMDEIASALKMSKKTIYKYFASKDELIKAVMWTKMQFIKAHIEQILKRDNNAVVKFKEMTDFLILHGLKFVNKFLNEIAELGPEWWTKVEEFRTKILIRNITIIVEQGKKEGLIINRDTEIIRDIYVAAIRAIVNPTFIKDRNLPLTEVIETVLEILFRGILTEKGMEIYNKINQGNNNEN